MNDKIANQVASYRARLACLNQPEHQLLWQNSGPAAFSTKVAEAQALLDNLTDVAGRQSVPITGTAAEKRRERFEVELAAYQLGGCLALYARDVEQEELAAQFDLNRSNWSRLRDEELIQRVRLLEQEASTLTGGTPEVAEAAANYGVTPERVTELTTQADEFEAVMVAPQEAIADRSVLTAELPQKSREVKAKFEEIEYLMRLFEGTEAGDEMIAYYQASSRVIDRGRRNGNREQQQPVGT